MEELLFEPPVRLAALVRGGEISAAELAEASLRRIEALDPELNAFAEVDAEGALATAAAIAPGDPRPFAGVPIAIKANTAVKGRLLHFCSALLEGNRARHDAFVVRRLREAGFVIVGMTNLPEFGILPTTESRFAGPTRNPWDRDRTPGGSSGGSGAAVAAGMVPVAHANDGGGSTRIPGACCGLVAVKGSRGRVSRGPDQGDSFLVVDGALTHTVADSAALLDVMAGYEAGDATWAPRPLEPFALSARRDPGRLRIAFSLPNALEAPLDPECEGAVRETAEQLASLGHEVVEAGPSLPGKDLLRLFASLFGPAVSVGMAYGERVAGRPPSEDELEPLSRALRDMSEGLSAVDQALATMRLQAMARRIVGFFADHDVLLTPALAERPLRIGECTGMGEHPMADFARSGRFTPYTAIFNVTGQPALTLPVRFGDDGLPTSVQLVGRPLAEDVLLSLAAQLEAAVALPPRRPASAAQH